MDNQLPIVVSKPSVVYALSMYNSPALTTLGCKKQHLLIFDTLPIALAMAHSCWPFSSKGSEDRSCIHRLEQTDALVCLPETPQDHHGHYESLALEITYIASLRLHQR